MNCHLSQMLSAPLIKDSLKLSSSNVMLFLLPLAVTPILSRLYDPSLFGEWGVFSGVFVMIQIILYASYEYVIIQSDEEEVTAICALCLLIAFSFISLCVLLFQIGLFFEIGFFRNFPCPDYLFAYLLITAWLGIFQNIANRQKRYGLMAASYALMGGSQAVFRIIFGLSVLFANGLIAGTIYAQLLNVLFFACFLPAACPKELIRTVSWHKIRTCAKKYHRFPLYDAPSLLLSFAAFNLPVVILSLYFSKTDVGYYSVVIQLLLMPLSFVGNAIGKVYYQQISQNQTNQTQISEKSLTVVKIVAYLSVLPTLCIVVGGDRLIAVFLGEKWTTTADMVLCLTLWSIPTILTQPLLSLYRCLDRQRTLLIYDALYFTAGIGALIGACMAGCRLYPTLILYALACSIARTLLFRDILKRASIRATSLPTPAKWLWGGCILLLAIRLFSIL